MNHHLTLSETVGIRPESENSLLRSPDSLTAMLDKFLDDNKFDVRETIMLSDYLNNRKMELIARIVLLEKQ